MANNWVEMILPGFGACMPYGQLQAHQAATHAILARSQGDRQRVEGCPQNDSQTMGISARYDVKASSIYCRGCADPHLYYRAILKKDTVWIDLFEEFLRTGADQAGERICVSQVGCASRNS